jgi:hypothetical protein
LGVVDNEQLAFGTADGELLAAEREVPDLRVMDAGRHALAGMDVVPGPELSEPFAGQGQFADELDEAGVVGIGSDGLAEAGDQPGGGLVPVRVQRLLGGTPVDLQ